jgi:hypothetical protein
LTRTGDTVGGLLNATLGNLTELVIALAALHPGEYMLVKASIAGALVTKPTGEGVHMQILSHLAPDRRAAAASHSSLGATRGRRFRALSFAVLGLIVGATKPAMASSGFEVPPMLKASDLAPAELLKGPRFHVDPKVPTDGLLAKFTIRSDFGDFEAEGPGMLGIRVGEIQALDVMSKTEKSEAFQRALVGSAKRTGKSIATAVTNPVETAKGLPAGVGRFFQRVGRGVKTGAQQASDYVSGTKEEGEEATSTGGAAQQVGSAAADIIGQQDSRRRVAKVLKVDPYTTNPVLDKELNKFAWVVWAGEFGLDMGINMVPGGMAITLTRTWVSDLVWDMNPGDLNVHAQKQLEELGVPSDVIDRFLRQKAFTLTTRTALLEGLAALGPGPGRVDVIPWALTAKSDTQARFIAGSVMILADYQKKDPIAQLRVSGTLVGRTKAGALVVPAPADYVSWTTRVAGVAKRPDLAAPNRQILLSGRLSPRARQELKRLHWVTHERVKAGVPRPGGPGALEGTPTNPSPERTETN